MKKLFFISIFVLVAFAAHSQTPTFTFECFCGTLTPADTTCDICNTTTQSRYFKGLLIRKNGTAFRWIEEPYTVIQNFNALTFRELIPNAEQIRIELSGTQWTTIEGFRDSVQCPCAGGGSVTLVPGPGISIYNDTIAVVPQQIDTFDIVGGDTLRISLSRDSVPFHYVILPSGTDTSGYNYTFEIVGDSLCVTDGAGTFCVDVSQFFDNTDTSGYNYSITLSGDTLYLTDGAGTLDVDLSGINTDNQKIDTFSISGNVVSLSIERDNEPAKTITLPTPDGSETIVTAGDLITVTGTGTFADPYVVSSTFADLPYYLNDEEAISDGLFAGNTYLLAPGNTFAMPSGMYKVVIGCGYDCAVPMRFFPSDGQATANGVPAGRQYATSASNIYGVLYGFVKVVAGTLASDTLQCSAALASYASDSLAIVGGLAEGEHYAVTAANAYGAPDGAERIVSTSSTTEADAGLCCEESETFPSFDNDADAISGGLSVNDHYKLSAANTYGWPTGAKKIVR